MTQEHMTIYCCGCEREVSARLTTGDEIYPHRKDLAKLPFWICDSCKNYVGCHHKTDKPTRPLGVIPTPEIRTRRQQIHTLIDPLWREGKMRRQGVYREMAQELGIDEFHSAEIRTLEQADRALTVARAIV